MKKISFDNLIFVDGAMGTMLSHPNPVLLNRENPEAVLAVHKAYADAGADIILANTFGANPIKMAGLDYSAEQAVTDGIKNAKKAGKLTALDMGPTGKLLKPLGDLEFEDAYNAFAVSAKAGEAAGADLVFVETMTDLYELKAAVLAAKENTSLPVFATVSIDSTGKLLTGGDIFTAVTMLEGLGVDALGLNCGLGPAQFKEFLPMFLKYSSTPVILMPNAGLPAVRDGKTVYDTTPAQFAEYMKEFAKSGVGVLGGCCGTSPEHISLMVKACKGITPTPALKKNITAVCSYSKTVIIGEKPVIIGERINPTGKKKFKEALRCNDINYILDEAFAQTEAGADILDVNVGLPEIDEKTMMTSAVAALQELSPTPLQIDSSDPAVLEAAMRIYNGKPLVNSVNGKQEVMDAVFPLVKKYGGVVVALTLDEDGIPSTAEGRIEIAKKIISRAADYGIDKKDIIIDPLTLTISSNQREAGETLRALSILRNMGMNTVLGVSNISFGLPQRERVNSTFFAMALYSGLKAAIINPLSDGMMSVYRSYNALSGYDAECGEYSHFYGGEAEVKTGPLTLYEMVINGLKDQSYAKTTEMLSEKEPLSIINEILIPALDEVGKGFEKGTVFLPKLLSCAQTAKNAFEAIKEKAENKQSAGHKILVATVEGDIHDIGKNIVVLLLQNYGYDVIDLGKDVPSDVIVKEVAEKNIKLVGLSALMTTTVTSMEETIKALRASGADCKIMVGGAVLTEEYAAMIGADYYAKDALCSVNYAKKIFGE